MIFSFFKKKKGRHLNTIAFYNLENLFDTVDDPDTLDEDFTPTEIKKWSKKWYKKKLYKLAKTLSEVGNTETKSPPVIVGIAEVENKTVIEDLLASEHLRNIDYGYVH